MSTDGTLDLFKAVRAAILADAYLATKFGARVFSSWGNQDAATPLARLWAGSRQFEMDGAGVGSEIDLWIYVFTTEDGATVGRTIANKVRDVLEGASLTLDAAKLIALDYRDTIARRDDASPSLQTVIVRFLATTVTA